jgi:hypothetical protein
VQKEGVVTDATVFWKPGQQAMCAIHAQTRDVNPWTI